MGGREWPSAAADVGDGSAGMILRDAFLTDDRVVAAYLVHGLKLLERELRASGLRPPAEVVAARGDLALVAQGRIGSERLGTSDVPIEGPRETLVSVNEAALRLGCDPRNVRALIARGTLPAWQSGRRWRIPEAALNELLEERSWRLA